MFSVIEYCLDGYIILDLSWSSWGELIFIFFSIEVGGFGIGILFFVFKW